MTDTLGLEADAPAPKRRRRRAVQDPAPAPVAELQAPGRRNKRRSTFAPAESDIFTKYASIQPRSARWIAFIEGECMVPSGRHAGELYRLREWQKDRLRQALDGALVFVWSGPRGITKTGLGAALLVAALYDQLGVEVSSVSTGMRTSRLSFDRAVRIIDLNPRLAEQALVLTNAADPRVELPTRGSKLFPLPAEEKYIVGGAPYFQLVDEVGYVDTGTYEAMQTACGKVPGGLLFACGTPGLGTADTVGNPNIMYQLRQAAFGEDPPEGLVYLEDAAHPNDDPADPETWRKANPGAGDLVELASIRLDYRTMSPARFAQMRLGIWSQHESAWMQAELWDQLQVDSAPLAPGAAIALGFDGSTSGDATALVAIDVETGRLVLLQAWVRPLGNRAWRVPRADVDLAVDAAFTAYNVVMMLADPWGWQSELQAWAERYGVKVQAFNTAAATRMAPATDAFMTSAVTGTLQWDGTPLLREHALAAVAKRTAVGEVIVKDARRPQQHDALTAAILAHEARRTAVPDVVPAIY